MRLHSVVCCLHGRQGMEHLWSRAVATTGNQWQMRQGRDLLGTPANRLVTCCLSSIVEHLPNQEGVETSSCRTGCSGPLETALSQRRQICRAAPDEMRPHWGQVCRHSASLAHLRRFTLDDVSAFTARKSRCLHTMTELGTTGHRSDQPQVRILLCSKTSGGGNIEDVTTHRHRLDPDAVSAARGAWAGG